MGAMTRRLTNSFVNSYWLHGAPSQFKLNAVMTIGIGFCRRAAIVRGITLNCSSVRDKCGLYHGSLRCLYVCLKAATSAGSSRKPLEYPS